MCHFIADSARIVVFPSGRAGALLVGGDNNVVPRSHNPLFSYVGELESVTRALLHADQRDGNIAFSRPLANIRAYPLASLSVQEQAIANEGYQRRTVETVEGVIEYSSRHLRPGKEPSDADQLFLQQVADLARGRITRVPLPADMATRCNDVNVILDLPPLANHYLQCNGSKVIAAVCLSKDGRDGYYALQTEGGEVLHARMSTGRLTKLGYRRSGTPQKYEPLCDAVECYAQRQKRRTLSEGTSSGVAP